MNPIFLNKIPVNGLIVHEIVDFDSSYYQNTDILELKQVKVDGNIKKNVNQDIMLSLKIQGSMKIPDSRTLEPIENPFEIEINEKIDETNEDIQEYLEKTKNILDIMGILWENIVLEVPISKTEGKKIQQEGKGWELVSEKRESIDPRLAPLRELLDSEKE